jgi:hypothetical protein
MHEFCKTGGASEVVVASQRRAVQPAARSSRTRSIASTIAW